jgi:hypothetical protein
MVVLEQITQMKRQGVPTAQIIQNLKEQGISPKAINEALSQSEIKSEINKNPQDTLADPFGNQQNISAGGMPNQAGMNPSTQGALPSRGGAQNINDNSQMQHSLEIPSQDQMQPQSNPPAQMQPQNPPAQMQQPFDQQSQFQQPQNPQPQEQYQEYAPEGYQEYAPEEYAEYPEYQAPQAVDIETMNDIASQIIEEKIKQMKKEVSLFTRFKKEFEEKAKNFEVRLTKLENTIEDLQLAIIKKVGSYGEEIKNLSNNMKATQESFSKMLDPITDKARELESTNESKEEPKAKKSRSKKEGSFESYLR